ncbi:phage tail protein [Yersinia enterocolitica]|uniref:phage tail protein n=1 Tax=Yersinia TaxID=629 RepID=UPI000B416E01|nr:phage tail protein [Yersinia intermedia]
MAKNEFLPFGTAVNANVLTNAEYQALTARSTGFVAGVAKSKELNTAWRQASVIASVVAQFIADNSGKDVLDNGDTATLKNNLEAALSAYTNGMLPTASTLVRGIVKLSNATNSNDEAISATSRAVKLAYDNADARLEKSKNGLDIQDKNQFSTNLGLGNASKRTIGNGVGQVPDMSYFTSGVGWRKTPDGCIRQWGITPPIPTGVATNVNFNIAFPLICDWVTICYIDSGVGSPATRGGPWQLSGYNKENFIMSHSGSSGTSQYMWVAEGR